MKSFCIDLLQFLIFPIFFVIGLLFIPSEIEEKIKLLNKISCNKNIIIMGDSKSVGDYNYKILQQEFPNHNIINIAIWAKNPQFNYSVYEKIFQKKQLTNSIIIYNTTYRHILNKSNKEFNKWQFKEKVDALLNWTHKFNHEKMQNGFINILKQDFKKIKTAKTFYKSLEEEYSADFTTQAEYLIKLKNLIERDGNNLFYLCDLPYDSTVNHIYSSLEYYAIYQKEIKQRFNGKILNFGYMKELEKKEYWFNHDHLHALGNKAFTPIFCDSLKARIK